MNYVFHFNDVLVHWPILVHGTINTIGYSLVGMVVGLGIGIIGAIWRNSQNFGLRAIATFYVELVRNTPMLVQLFLFFFALPSLGIRLTPLQAALLALVFNNGAYMTEIVRAGIESINPSQREAAVSLGLTWGQTFQYVILSQAMENVYPAMISQFIMLMLSTSLISSIGADELTSLGGRIQALNFRSFEVFTVLGVIYLCLTLLLQRSSALVARFIFPRRRAVARR